MSSTPCVPSLRRRRPPTDNPRMSHRSRKRLARPASGASWASPARWRCRSRSGITPSARWRTTSTSSSGTSLTGWSGYALIALGLVLLAPGGPVDGACTPRAGSTRARATRCSAGAPRSTCMGAALASIVGSAVGLPRLAADGPLPRSAGPALPGAQLVDRLRLPAGALRPRAVARPRAHARAQRDHRRGRPAAIERGLAEVRAEIDEDRFEVRPDDEDVHMAIERRLTELAGPGGRQAPHRALAQRPGRHRRGDAGARARARGEGAAARR